MNIHGLQKLTLLDYPGHTACTVFLAGCILRSARACWTGWPLPAVSR